MADTDIKDAARYDSVETLSKARMLAESRVKLIRSLLEDGDIEDEDYRKIQLLYAEARADVNAGLDRLLVELEATGSQAAVEPYERVAERAATTTAEFLKVSDQIIFGKDRGLVESGVEFAGSLVTAFVDIWKMFRGEKTARHELLLQRIESLKWDQFSEIK